MYSCFNLYFKICNPVTKQRNKDKDPHNTLSSSDFMFLNTALRDWAEIRVRSLRCRKKLEQKMIFRSLETVKGTERYKMKGVDNRLPLIETEKFKYTPHRLIFRTFTLHERYIIYRHRNVKETPLIS